MFPRSIPTALVATLAASLAVAGPVHADPGDTPVEPPAISRVTTENTSGGLTPYIPLFTSLSLTFTDSTPSEADRYRVVASGVGALETSTDTDSDPDGALTARTPGEALTDGSTYDLTVEELDAEGEVSSISAPQSFTFRVVRHPRKFLTSSRKIRGQWSYRVGDTARFRFVGTWEPGTRFSTQVWVSRTKRFTGDDFAANANGRRALVGRYDSVRPVLSVKIPRRVRGQYLWVSVLGWKDGTAGWTYQVPAEKVLVRR